MTSVEILDTAAIMVVVDDGSTTQEAVIDSDALLVVEVAPVGLKGDMGDPGIIVSPTPPDDHTQLWLKIDP
jgi:hypothetical protein